MRPPSRAIRRVMRSATPSSLAEDLSMMSPLHQVQRVDDAVAELDAGEWDHDSADAVDQEVAAQQSGRADGAIFHSPQCQWNQGDDDKRVEDDRREHRALRRLQAHDVKGA